MTKSVFKFFIICIIIIKLSVFDISMGIGVQSKNLPLMKIGDAHMLVNNLIESDDVVIFSKTNCPYCKMAKEVFDTLNKKYTAIELDQRTDGRMIQMVLTQITGGKTVPRVFIHGKFVGGGCEIKALFESGELLSLLK